jgi:UPF0716 protein FxsA
MRRWPFVLLFAIPLLDVVLLVYVASVIGGVATVALVVLTALIGLLLVRAEGRYTLGRLQRKLAAGEAPTAEVMDGALLLVAGAFLLTPGLVTDVVGLLLVLPPTRYPIRVALSRWVLVPALERRSGGFVSGNVYTFGFPGESGMGDVGPGRPGGVGEGPGGPAGGPSGASGRPGGPAESPGRERADDVDLGADAYDIDVEDADAEDRGDEGRDGDRDP